MPLLPDELENDTPTQQPPLTDATDVLALLRDKWRAPTLLLLSKSSGPLRYADIDRALDGISHTMLTRTLRHLETMGLVKRESFAEVPVRVEYSLTPLGRSLSQPLLGLEKWAKTHSHDVWQMGQSLEASRS